VRLFKESLLFLNQSTAKIIRDEAFQDLRFGKKRIARRTEYDTNEVEAIIFQH